MTTLLSSAALYEALKKIDFETDFEKVSVVRESIVEDKLILILSNYKDISIPCEPLQITPPRVQQGVEWDKIRDILGRVPEMPLVLTLDGNRASLTFEV